jgi:hypothetical protein
MVEQMKKGVKQRMILTESGMFIEPSFLYPEFFKGRSRKKFFADKTRQNFFERLPIFERLAISDFLLHDRILQPRLGGVSLHMTENLYRGCNEVEFL